MSRIDRFLATHPVFTLEEFKRDVGNAITSSTLHTHLKRYKKAGRIGTIKHGLYYVVPAGYREGSSLVDPYLVACKAAVDSIIGFHTAIELLGVGHSQFSRIYYLTQTPRRPFTFRTLTFQSVRVPRELVDRNREDYGTERVERQGHWLTITGKERTLVDCLERPEYCGGWEEFYRCAEKLPYVNFEVLAEYLELRGRKVLFAKTGFFLEQHREEFFVEESLLKRLEKEVPKQPAYLLGRSRKGRLVRRWNLVVPEPVLNRTWEEF
jgi:predicted transcriptional regulator of viral defense system